LLLFSTVVVVVENTQADHSLATAWCWAGSDDDASGCHLIFKDNQQHLFGIQCVVIFCGKLDNDDNNNDIVISWQQEHALNQKVTKKCVN
jgi:hypothetical protein